MEKYSTISITQSTAKRADKFCKQIGCTKKDFVSLSLDYFLRNGIDPTKHENPRTEMEKLNKRMDQVFAFFKAQERDLIKPLTLSVSKRIAQEESAQELMISNLKKIADGLTQIQSTHRTKLDAFGKNLDGTLRSFDFSLKEVAAFLAAKKETGYMGNMLQYTDKQRKERGLK